MKFLRFKKVPKAPIKNKIIIVKKNKEICKKIYNYSKVILKE